MSEIIKIFINKIKFKKGSGGDISIPVYWFFGGSEVNYWCPHYQTNLGDYSVAHWGCYLLSFQTGLRGGHLYIFGEIVPVPLFIANVEHNVEENLV